MKATDSFAEGSASFIIVQALEKVVFSQNHPRFKISNLSVAILPCDGCMATDTIYDNYKTSISHYYTNTKCTHLMNGVGLNWFMAQNRITG